MKSIKIKAVFKGQDKSCGYRTDKKYTLIIDHQQFVHTVDSPIVIERYSGDGYCEYESLMSFLENWDNIQRIDKEARKPLFITEDGVEMFEGNKYWMVWYKNGWEFYPNAVTTSEELSDKTIRFSTEKAAKDWIAHQKPKSFKPEELVDGKIYVDETPRDGLPRIFRFKELKNQGGMFYSQVLPDFRYLDAATNYHFNGSTIRPATLAEKQTLVKAEVEHGYFHELKINKA